MLVRYIGPHATASCSPSVCNSIEGHIGSEDGTLVAFTGTVAAPSGP